MTRCLRALVAVLALHTLACRADDPSVEGDGDGDGGVPDAGTASAKLTPCLDRPPELPRPPTTRAELPCDLLPPDFKGR